MSTISVGEILAKSNGAKLIEHSKRVSDFAVVIANKIVGEVGDRDNIIETVRIASLLHDIGKSVDCFQKFLKGEKTDPFKYNHNETGWAFLAEFLNIDNSILQNVLDAVYWHHGIDKKQNSDYISDILEDLSDEDIHVLSNVLVDLMGEECVYEKNLTTLKTPRYYSSEDDNNNVDTNVIKTLVRTCVISADRLASSVDEDEDIETCVDEIVKKSKNLELDMEEMESRLDMDRLNMQIDISKQTSGTSIIKAPAGFGKTILGILWSLKTHKKLIWVCPRNMVAQSVYSNVLQDLELLGLSSLSVELFLSNETKDKNAHSNGGFTSDIIITNIDSFLAPSVNNSFSDKLFFINSCNVVFDEFHELVGNAALFSCFVNIMKLRHRFTDSETLMLSATPSNLNFLWDSFGNETQILPNKTEHYPASHKKPVLIGTVDGSVTMIDKSNSLIIHNSIANAQRESHNNNIDVIHSSFEEDKKSKMFEELLLSNGKRSDVSKCKQNVSATHVVQSSLDVSFSEVFDSVLSPESTLQRGGRGGRFGEFDFTKLTIFKPDCRSEKKVIENLYNTNLNNLWFEYIQKLNGSKIILDDMYCHYNEFYKSNERPVKSYINSRYNESREALSYIHPIKFKGVKNNDIITSGGNKLRSDNSEIFFICKKFGSDEYSEPFSTKVYNNIGAEFSETGNMVHRLVKTMKHLRSINDERYDYNDAINNKRINIDQIRKMARKSNTPYIRYDVLYHEKYGVIKKRVLNELGLQ